MTKIKKKIVATACACTLVLGGSITALAATDSADQVFYGFLPASQGDIEFSDSIVAKTTNASTFEVNVTFIDGYDYFRVWTESEWGSNFSDPDDPVYEGNNVLDYTTTPSRGTNVVLNADNPHKVDFEVWVRGYWTPN